MLNDSFKDACKRTAIFWLIYTIAFIIFFGTLSYTLPFLLAFLLALALQPLIRFLVNKLKFRRGLASLAASVLAFAVVGGILTLVVIKLIKEITNLVNWLSQVDFSNQIGVIQGTWLKVQSYISNIDADFWQRNQSNLLNLFSGGKEILDTIFNQVLSFITSLPIWITIIVVVIFSTYFFSKDMGKLKNSRWKIFTPQAMEHMKNAQTVGGGMLGKYAAAYGLLISITFVITLISFNILNIKYALTLSIVAAFADIVPVFGIGIIYVPLAVIKFFQGQVGLAITLLAIWIIISVIRQILEPRLVAHSINVHPVAMLAVLYIGIKAGSFVLIIYFTLMIISYQLVKRIGLLESKKTDKKTKEKILKEPVSLPSPAEELPGETNKE